VIKAVWDEGFKRSYRKRVKKNEKLKKEILAKDGMFLTSPSSSQLRTHKLSGKLEGLWAFSVDDDCRVIFEFIGEDRVLLIDIGSHNEVY
jgi:addiction module RelE/StbE family toxin